MGDRSLTIPLRVLILEDSPTDAEVMVHHLREAGFAPDWRRVDTEAEFRAHLEPTLDLILADYTLPDFTARRALHLLQDDGSDIPAIVITGTVSEEIALECLRLGATDYLLKDRLARLGEAVRGALSQRTLRHEKVAAETARKVSGDRANFLDDVLERSSHPSGIGYPDGRLGICNSAFCALVGYTEVEMRELNWSRDLTPPEWRAGEADQLAELHRTGLPVRYEKEYLRKDGVRVPVELLVHLVRDADGNPPYYHAFVTDLTERKRAEHDLTTRTRQLEAVRAVGDEITRELDLTRVLQLISRRAAELVGNGAVKVFLWEDTSQVLVQKAWSGGEDPTLAGLAIRLGEGLAGQVAERREGIIVNDYQAWPFAQPQVLEWSKVTAALAEPLLYRGRLVGVILLDNRDTGRPFTEDDRERLRLFAAPAAIAIENARLHHAAVRRGEELEALLQATRSVMSGLDLQAILERIAAEAARIAGTPHVKVLLVDKEAGQLRAGALRGTTARGFPVPLGTSLSGLVATTGEPLFVSDCSRDPRNVMAERDRELGIVTYLGLPIKTRGEVVGVLTFNTMEPRGYTPDELAYLTSFADHAAIAIENAQLFAEVNESYRNLQLAQDEMVRSEKLRALGQMAAGAAHDLNNMLAVILGQAELLRLEVDHPRVEEALAPLQTAASDCAAVVRRLQDFARQRARSALTPVRLAVVVREALDITRPRWKDEPQRLGLLIQVETDLADLPPILGYAPEIRESLTNLIINAVDAMPHGGTLTFGGSVDGSWVVLSVTDTGIGMSEEVRGRLFEPFFTTKGVRGTGLGLAVTYAIMERHGGRIQVRSQPGHGTTFTLRFQAAPPDIGETLAPAQARPILRRILVIDDDAAVRATVAGLLRATGHVVTEADGGSAGLAQVAAGTVEVVVTDLGMPEMTGWDVARAIKARSPALPVILLTGWGEQTAADGPGGEAVDRVLAKPVRLNDLLQAIADLSPLPGRNQAPTV